jgi:hypothetical protein
MVPRHQTAYQGFTIFGFRLSGSMLQTESRSWSSLTIASGLARFCPVGRHSKLSPSATAPRAPRLRVGNPGLVPPRDARLRRLGEFSAKQRRPLPFQFLKILEQAGLQFQISIFNSDKRSDTSQFWEQPSFLSDPASNSIQLQSREPAYALLAQFDEPFRFVTGDLIPAVYDSVSFFVAFSQPRVPKHRIVRNRSSAEQVARKNR